MKTFARTLAIAGVVAVGGLALGATPAQAQGFGLVTPGFSMGVGPGYGAYGGGYYGGGGYVGGYPLVAPAPVVVAPVPYYGVRPFYGPRGYYGGYNRGYGYGPYRHYYRR